MIVHQNGAAPAEYSGVGVGAEIAGSRGINVARLVPTTGPAMPVIDPKPEITRLAGLGKDFMNEDGLSGLGALPAYSHIIGPRAPSFQSRTRWIKPPIAVNMPPRPERWPPPRVKPLPGSSFPANIIQAYQSYQQGAMTNADFENAFLKTLRRRVSKTDYYQLNLIVRNRTMIGRTVQEPWPVERKVMPGYFYSAYQLKMPGGIKLPDGGWQYPKYRKPMAKPPMARPPRGRPYGMPPGLRPRVYTPKDVQDRLRKEWAERVAQTQKRGGTTMSGLGQTTADIIPSGGLPAQPESQVAEIIDQVTGRVKSTVAWFRETYGDETPVVAQEVAPKDNTLKYVLMGAAAWYLLRKVL